MIEISSLTLLFQRQFSLLITGPEEEEQKSRNFDMARTGTVWSRLTITVQVHHVHPKTQHVDIHIVVSVKY